MFFHIFGPPAPKISLGFSQDVPLLTQYFLHFATFLALLCQHKYPWVFAGFSSSDANFLVFSTFIALLRQESFNFHSIFPLLMQHFPQAHTNTHTHIMVPAESAKVYRNSDLKHVLCKAIFYIFKNESARIYLCKAIFYIFRNNSPKQTFMYVIILAGMVKSGADWRLPQGNKPEESCLCAFILPDTLVIPFKGWGDVCLARRRPQDNFQQCAY